MAQITIEIPDELHQNTAELISRFTSSLADKLRKAEKKYGYGDNWKDDSWAEKCNQKLIEHVMKGDPLDVAAYCAFMFYHGWTIETQIPSTVKISDINTVKELKSALAQFDDDKEIRVSIGDTLSARIKNISESKSVSEDDTEWEELLKQNTVWLEI